MPAIDPYPPVEFEVTLNNQEGVVVDEVVVAGERIQRTRKIDPNPTIGDVVYSVWNGTGWQPLDPIDQALVDSAFAEGGDINNPITQPKVSVMVPEDDPDYEEALHAALLIEKQISNIHSKITSLPNNTIIHLPNNNTITVGELKQLWDRIDYRVTDSTYGAGRGGEVVGDVSYVNYGTILSSDGTQGYYASAGDTGVSYYVLHEISHLTPESQGELAYQWSLYNNWNPSYPKPSFYNSPYGLNVEEFTNSIYFGIAGGIGEGIWTDPPPY